MILKNLLNFYAFVLKIDRICCCIIDKHDKFNPDLHQTIEGKGNRTNEL